jgi:hypothetical protein
MSKKHGHIKMSRKAYRAIEKGGDLLWNEPRVFSRWEAWEYLIARAAFAPHTRKLRKGGVVKLERGETPPLAVRYLAQRWGWSRSKVHKFLALLGTDLARIRGQQKTPDGDTYLVINYALYQDRGDSGEPELGTRTRQARDKIEDYYNYPYAGEEKLNPHQAKVAMWAEFDERAEALPDTEREKARAIVRGIIEGDTHTAWMDQDGRQVEWWDRPRLFRLALDERKANGGKLHVVLRQFVIPREYDPFPVRKSTDPKPGTEAAAVRADPKRETPGRSRTPGRASTDEHPVNYVPTPEDAKQAAARVAEREARDRAAQDATIRQWEVGHELDARRIRNEVTDWAEGNKFVLPHLREQTIETEYRRRALEAINGKAAA